MNVRIGALVGLLTLVAAACTTAPDGQEPQGTAGGIFRMEADEMPWITSGYGFDPTTEYFQTQFSIFSNLMLRPLMSYNHRGPDEGGNDPIPDLAASPPEVSEDGKTYTFTLRSDVMWQPPLDRAVTSDDVLFAFERLGTKKISADAGNYAFYYTPFIEGMEAFEAGDAETISGIETPDESTIVFTLTEPVGHFLAAMAMPATAPIPREVGECFMTKPNSYGPYTMSSSAYMIEGSDTLDISDCKALRADSASGFSFEEHLILVRNPNYDRDKDNLEIRSALPDGFELRLNTNVEDSYAKLERGELEHVFSDIPPATLRTYQTNAELEERLHIEPDDAVWYMTMNLTTPPFDDVNVRRAANYVLNKKGMIQVIGGDVTGVPAKHIFPESILPIEGFDPYETEEYAGDVELAKAEMAKSKYDTDGDGLCDAPVCNNLRHVTRNTDPFPKLVPVIEKSFEAIGIKLRTIEAAGFYDVAGVPKNEVPLTSGGGWGKDWADPMTFILPLFLDSSISPAGNVALSLVGITADTAEAVGVELPEGGVPSIQEDYDRCFALSGGERTTCWADLDKKLMEEVVPWIPWRWSTANHIAGPAVTNWTWDSFASWPGYAHMGVDAAKQT